MSVDWFNVRYIWSSMIVASLLTLTPLATPTTLRQYQNCQRLVGQFAPSGLYFQSLALPIMANALYSLDY